ncbi:MAG: SdrD B-like domain-containing protein [Caldilineaceae bacterium]
MVCCGKEVLCDPAPIEIGNRVWDDYDGDGQQDAGEPGLNGLTVRLQTPTGSNTTTTSDDGNYYFNVEPYTAYTITVATPTGYQLTASNTAALDAANLSSNHAISDTIDSDALLVNNVPTILYTTGGPGQNNHSLDFGFVQPASGQVDILNIAPSTVTAHLAIDKALVSPANGVAAVGDPIIFSLTITNTGPVTVTELDVSDNFDLNYLIYNTASITPDAVGAGTLNWVGANDGVNPASGSLQSLVPLGAVASRL